MYPRVSENYSETSSEPLFKLIEIKKEVIKKGKNGYTTMLKFRPTTISKIWLIIDKWYYI